LSLNDLNKKNNETKELIQTVEEIVEKNEKVTVYALNDLNENIKNLKTFNVTYNELKDLYDNNNLIVDAKYRIIDYVTTTSQADTRSANHQFDIIVEATSTNTINENAKACLHDFDDSDSYFEGNKLDAWEIKYCFDNDTSRFSWADTTNGKGVIYYMKDEYKNECWYDFKNIQFLRTSDFFNTNSFLPHLEGDNYYYTFSKIVDGVIVDNTVNNTSKTYSINNSIGNRGQIQRKLSDIIFINLNGVTRNNIIGDSSYSCTFGDVCHDNVIADYCYNNVIGNEFKNNNIKQLFTNNKVTGTFQYNTLGIQCYNNNFSGHIWFTTFSSQFNYCSFNIPEGSKLEYCEFGSGIGFLNGIPAIRKITFENNVAWYDTTTYITNLYTTDGRTLAEALTVEHDDQLYVSKVGDKYDVNSLSNIKKNINDNILTPIYSNPNLDFESTSNNANIYGYVGQLDAINVKGDLILIDSIGVYVREGYASPNLDVPVWCRLLKFVNDTWEIIYQSVESKTINGIAPETLFSFKMKAVNEQNKLIKSTDKIAIVYADAEDAYALSSVKIGTKSILGVRGALENPLLNTSTGRHDYCPAFVIGYLSMADIPKNVVTIENAQTITGKKQFNDGINISDKSFITSEIDSGELKILHNNSTKGFIIRTKNTSDSILPLELLSTNGSASYQYDFPSKGGKIAMIDDVNNVKTFTKNSVNESLVNALKFDEIESGTKTFETSSIGSNFKVVYLSDMNRFAAKSLILTNPKYYVTWPSYNDYPSSNSYKSYSLTDESEFYGPIVGKFYLYQGDLCVWDGNEFQVKFYSKEQVDKENNILKNLISENEEVTSYALNNLSQDVNNLYDEISDIETIRQGAAKGATALQSYTEQYKGTVTGIKINGTTKNPTNGIVDLGIVSEEDKYAYPLVNHGTSDTTFTLTPNTFHVWGEVVTLDLDFGTETSGIMNEYLFQFTSGSESTTLILPYGIKFNSDLIIEENKIYQISILNGLGTVMSWDI
jgi:hypothetical protein